jgi:hypothetical protein
MTGAVSLVDAAGDGDAVIDRALDAVRALVKAGGESVDDFCVSLFALGLGTNGGGEDEDEDEQTEEEAEADAGAGTVEGDGVVPDANGQNGAPAAAASATAASSGAPAAAASAAASTQAVQPAAVSSEAATATAPTTSSTEHPPPEELLAALSFSSRSSCPGDCLVVRLWHMDVFLGARESARGDPGARCRDVHCHPFSRAIATADADNTVVAVVRHVLRMEDTDALMEEQEEEEQQHQQQQQQEG